MKQNLNVSVASAGMLIVVLGMHRGGTSVMARALTALGADLGTRLTPAAAGNNDKGFFEDPAVVELNEMLLGATGAMWHTVGNVDLSKIDPLVLDKLQQQAVTLLREKCKAGGIAGLKDPRFSRLLPFWQPVFESAGLDVRYVIAVRNPISVVQSLAKRDGFGDEKSYLLWLGHLVPALRDTKGCVRTIVDYDRLIDDPAGQLQRMASQLGVTLDHAQAETFGREFVEERLRHTRFQVQDVLAVRSAPSAVKQLYAELDETCSMGTPGRDPDAGVEAGRQFLADLEPLLRYEVRVQQHIEQQAAAIVQRDQQVKMLTNAVNAAAQRERQGLQRSGVMSAAGAMAVNANAQMAAPGQAGLLPPGQPRPATGHVSGILPSFSATPRPAAPAIPATPAAQPAVDAARPYFPNQPQPVMQLEMLYRREVEKLPQPSRQILYSILSSCVPGLVGTSFGMNDGMVIAKQMGREIAFPDPMPMIKYSHIVFGYEQWLQRKYCLPGFVAVEPGDIVIDCGGFVGGFSLSAAKVAAQVHIFEPEHENFRCVQRNFAGARNVIANEAGLYSSSGTTTLNISRSGVEHSMLAPDDGETIETREIKIVALRDYLVARGLPRFDFVKIEAEGVELEVFEGLGDLKPRKLAIDVSPERNGESPAAEFHHRLTALGYEVRLRGHVMFAKLNG